MSQRLHAIEIDCDALPYALVKACRWAGFQDPEDVRWCRLCHFQKRQPTWRDFFHFRTLKALFVRDKTRDLECNCGQELPTLGMYIFTLSTGDVENYYLGQCSRCRTMYWEKE
jgi:hypothetical protein